MAADDSLALAHLQVIRILAKRLWLRRGQTAREKGAAAGVLVWAAHLKVAVEQGRAGRRRWCQQRIRAGRSRRRGLRVG